MQVEKPPVNGNARQKLAWLLGVLCTVLLILTLASGGMLLRHESQIAVHGTRIGVIEQMLVRIESKLDRLLEPQAVSTILTIADAVVASLNAGAFDPPLNAVRRYQPTFELADLALLQVSVVPRSLEMANATRATGYFDCAIDIGVQKKLDGDAGIGALVNLVEQIADHLRQKRLATAPEAAFVSIANEPVVALEHLDQHRSFTSILMVTYRVRR